MVDFECLVNSRQAGVMYIMNQLKLETLSPVS